MTSLEVLPLVNDWASFNGLPVADPVRVIEAFLFLRVRRIVQGDQTLPGLEEIYREATRFTKSGSLGFTVALVWKGGKIIRCSGDKEIALLLK
jgi:hypothetical protein